MGDEDNKPAHVIPHHTMPVPVSVDLSQTHLRTIHVVLIVASLIGAGIAVAKTYITVASQVEAIVRDQKDFPTKDDLGKLQTNISSDMNHAASERVKFYLEHGKLDCDVPRRGSSKTSCRMIWPPPKDD